VVGCSSVRCNDARSNEPKVNTIYFDKDFKASLKNDGFCAYIHLSVAFKCHERRNSHTTFCLECSEAESILKGGHTF